MQTKENQRVKLTKQLIRQGLFTLLKEKELEKITVSELCRISEVNRTTFYNHYSCVEDVLKEIAVNILEELRQIASFDKPIVNSLEILQDICRYLKENADTLIVLFRCKKDTDITAIFDNFMQRYSDKVKANTHLDNDEMKLVLTFLMNGIYNMLKMWLICDMDKSPEEIAGLIYKLFNKNYDVE